MLLVMLSSQAGLSAGQLLHHERSGGFAAAQGGKPLAYRSVFPESFGGYASDILRRSLRKK